MEQNFKAAHTPEGDQVTIANMYLFGDVKLGGGSVWRRMLVRSVHSFQFGRSWSMSYDISSCLSTWSGKPEAFQPLKQTSTVWYYVNTFIDHLLEIKNMSEDAKLFVQTKI